MISILDSVQLTKHIQVKNRVVLAPLTLSACQPGGYVSQADLDFYSRRASSVGMVITGSAYVHPQGQAFRDSYSVAEDDKIVGLRHLAGAIKEQGALAILQIYHGGRMVPPSLVKDQPIAPSAVLATHGQVVLPRPLKNAEVDELIDQFVAATRRAIRAGFDGVELHGANTYLIQQFFSPHSNRRQDKWGGSLNNRMRFAKTLLKRVKQVAKEEGVPSFLVGYRFSPEEIEEPGIGLGDCLHLLDQLIGLGVDYLHLSMTQVFRPSLRSPENWQPIIHSIVKRIRGRVPLIAVGGIQTSQDVRAVLELGIPMIAVGKSLLLDPDWTEKITEGREEDIIRRYHPSIQDDLKLPAGFVQSFGAYLTGDDEGEE